MRAYYNEYDPYAAQWLRNLIEEGLIAYGDVDERSINDVKPRELKGYTQCHFFAGLGGWSYALRLAGWPDDREVWTGSCPCQPFSVAGARKGFDDPRHLWPTWQRLVKKRKPSVVFGEQVARAPDWLNLVRSDLETMGYAVGAIPLEAASAGADHFRDRYWFVANDTLGTTNKGFSQTNVRKVSRSFDSDYGRDLAHGHGHGLEVSVRERGNAESECSTSSRNDFRPLVYDPSERWGEGWTESEFRSRGFTAAVANIENRQYIECYDGKWRRLPPPRVRWLGNGVPARVDQLRAFGNAIDPRPASAFIKAFLSCER